MADVGLGVHRKRGLFPGIDLELCHAHKCLLCGQIVRKRTRDVVGVTFPPKPVHHQIHIFQLRVVTEFRDEKVIQFCKCLLEFRGIVTGFPKIEASLVFPGFVTDVHDRYFVLQKIRQRKLLRLDIRTGKLDAESNTQIVSFGSVECDLPNRGQAQLAGPRLHIAPVAANIQYVHKGQRSHFLHALFQRFPTALHPERRPVLLPRVADQPSAKISYVIAGRLSSEDREPPLVLVNAKWPLVESIRNLRRAKWITLPQMVRYIRPHRRTHESACTCKKSSCL